MRGSLYVIAEILLYLVLAAAIGYVIGRMTSGRAGGRAGDRSGPLKRLSEVDTGPARATEDAGQATDLRRRLGVAYQTIRELEESNMLLREAAENAEAEPEEGEPEGEEPEDPKVAGESAEPDADADEKTPTPEANEPGSTDQPAVETEARQAGGPAELIRAAKAAKEGQAGSPLKGSSDLGSPSDAAAEPDASS